MLALPLSIELRPPHVDDNGVALEAHWLPPSCSDPETHNEFVFSDHMKRLC